MKIVGPRTAHDGQYYSKFHNKGNSGAGTVNIDWDEGNFQLLTLTGSPTLTFSNMQAGGRYLLKIKTGAGSFSVTWPTITWLRTGGAAPSVPAAASKTAVAAFSYDGTDIDGSYADNA